MKEAAVQYAMIIEKGERNYSAYFPDLPGCVATGATLEEIKQRMREALELHLRTSVVFQKFVQQISLNFGGSRFRPIRGEMFIGRVGWNLVSRSVRSETLGFRKAHFAPRSEALLFAHFFYKHFAALRRAQTFV